MTLLPDRPASPCSARRYLGSRLSSSRRLAELGRTGRLAAHADDTFETPVSLYLLELDLRRLTAKILESIDHIVGTKFAVSERRRQLTVP